jgi:outer membrane DcaP-like protein
MSFGSCQRKATFAAAIAALAAPAFAQDGGGTKLDITGFAMLDMGYQTNQSHPDWFDVVRPTKLPSFTNEFAPDGNWFAGVRQSRFGVRSSTPTEAGELKTIFEFELFGTGADAGQTTFRLRHAWGELGKFGAGQTWSPFMDIDVFPNSIEYWGPNGMVFFRNVQVRYTPWQTDSGSRFVVALERPGASADQGDYADRVELQGIVPHFPMPDISAHWRLVQDWGHLQVAGIFRRIEWEDTTPVPTNLSGHENGYGINVSSNVKLGNNVLRLSVVYGEGVQNYMNDAPEDIGIDLNPGNPTQPLVGKALPMTGVVAFIDLNWSSKWTSTVGYSFLDIDNTAGQSGTSFKKGQYALFNLLYHPTSKVLLGPELQWGDRENMNGFTSDDVRLQFSARYDFGLSLGGN